MRFHSRFPIIFVLLLAFSAAIRAEAGNPYETSLQAYRVDNPQRPVLVVLTLTPGPEWHAYGNVQGPSGFPTVVTGTAEGAPLEALYPPPVPGPDPIDPSLTVELYDGPTPFFLPLPAAPAKVSARI